jgi:hypothetical protein
MSTSKLILRQIGGLVLALATFIALIAIPANGQAPAKPVREHPFHTEGGVGAPSSLNGLYKLADMIVVATVVDSYSDDETTTTLQGSTFTLVRTVYRLDVQDVIKRDKSAVPVPPSRVNMELRGGTRDRGDYVDAYVDESLQAFRNGEQYLLFLKAAAPDRFVTVTGGAEKGDSVFLVDESTKTLMPRGRSPLAKSLKTHPLDSVAASLRSQGEVKR